MTIEEAIKVLRTESVEIGGNAVSVARWLTALDVAVKALEDVPDKDAGKNEPMTNAQKIRSMSDEELAEFLFNGDVEYCHAGLCKDGETCRICCLRWLQQPAEEANHDRES